MTGLQNTLFVLQLAHKLTAFLESSRLADGNLVAIHPQQNVESTSCNEGELISKTHLPFLHEMKNREEVAIVTMTSLGTAMNGYNKRSSAMVLSEF